MRPNEAKHIEVLLASLASETLSPCLNIGSSDTHFRTVEQPHVEAHVLRPLRERGVRIINLDLKENEGVDLIGDVLDPDFQMELGALRPKLVMCSNLLEHLTNPVAFAHVCASIVKPGGFLLITGPYSYPYHLDPIDTLYRPGPDEIHRLFPDFSCLHEAVVADTTYLEDLMSQNTPRQLIRLIGGHALKLPYLLFTNLERFKARYHRYFWLFRRYTSTVVLLQRPS
jgi:SAM-dependent methyltransferase